MSAPDDDDAGALRTTMRSRRSIAKGRRGRSGHGSTAMLSASIMLSSPPMPIRPWRCWQSQSRRTATARCLPLLSATWPSCTPTIGSCRDAGTPGRVGTLLGSDAGRDAPLCVSYWMNRLQNLPTTQDVFVTLNPQAGAAPGVCTEHRDLSAPAVRRARRSRRSADCGRCKGTQHTGTAGPTSVQGSTRMDCRSGLAVAEALGGVRRPWTRCRRIRSAYSSVRRTASTSHASRSRMTASSLYVGHVTHRRHDRGAMICAIAATGCWSISMICRNSPARLTAVLPQPLEHIQLAGPRLWRRLRPGTTGLCRSPTSRRRD